MLISNNLCQNCSIVKFLIEMIHDIFEEQTSIGKVVNRIMKRSLKLMKCEHCSVLLLNEPLLDSGDDQLIDRKYEVKFFLLSDIN